MAQSSNNGNNGTRLALSIVVPLISALVGGGSGTYFILESGVAESVVRPDPFTGTQGAAIVREIALLRKDLELHTGINHPDIRNEFDRRITTLEANQSTIIRNQERILDRLE